MKRLIIVLLAILITSCDQEPDRFQDGSSYRISFGDHENGKLATKRLINKLNQAHIPYRVDRSGKIEYEGKYRREVDELRKEVLFGNFEPKISKFKNVKTIDTGLYTDKKAQKAYLEALKNNGIEFELVGYGDLHKRVRVPVENYAYLLDVKRKFHSKYFYNRDELDSNTFESIFIHGVYDDEGKIKKDKYVAAFREAEIPIFNVDRLDAEPNDNWVIEYNQIYGPKVDLIRQKIESME